MHSRSCLWAIVAGAVLAIGASSLASADPVVDRQAAMKTVGQSMKEAAGMKSPTTYDAAKVRAAMDSVAANAKKLKGLYPVGSDKDPKTAADPKIWQNKADFDKRLTEVATLATAAGKTTTVDAFKASFAPLGDTCKSCHDIYRKKKTN